MKRKDYFIAGLLGIIAALLIFINLGTTRIPETYWDAVEGDSVSVEFSEETMLSDMKVYAGRRPGSIREYGENATNIMGRVEAYFYSASGREEGMSSSIVGSWGLYTWEDSFYGVVQPLPVVPIKKITITIIECEAVVLHEIVFLGTDGKVVDLTEATYSVYAIALFDEQTLYKGRSHMGELEFDEVSFGFSAYDILHGLPSYENTHPPLGKIIIGSGIQLFGISPFGIRFAPALFGLFTILLLYLFGKKLFGSTVFASLLTGLYLIDGIHLGLSRGAFLEPLAIFFIILSYYFMLCFYKSDRRSGEDTHRKPLIYLFAAGLVFGIGVSIKWTNLFAGLGLFAIFTVAFFRKRKDVIKKKHSLYTLITAGISFIFVSGLIYLLSYLPYLRVQSGNLFSVFFKNQEYMFQHHTMTEVYMDIGQSPWYQWPLNLRGYRRITPSQYMYYANNVALYGAGLFATVFVMVYTAMLWYSKNRPSRGMNNISDLKEKHKTEQGKGDSILFLLSGSLSAFIPWVFVSRKTFSRLYAYTVIFMIGFIVFTLREIYTIGQKNIKLRKEKVTIQGVGSIICAILLLVFIFNFLLMLPVFLGIPISRTYAALLGIV